MRVIERVTTAGVESLPGCSGVRRQVGWLPVAHEKPRSQGAVDLQFTMPGHRPGHGEGAPPVLRGVISGEPPVRTSHPAGGHGSHHNAFFLLLRVQNIGMEKSPSPQFLQAQADAEASRRARGVPYAKLDNIENTVFFRFLRPSQQAQIRQAATDDEKRALFAQFMGGE
jgi:hypothetical protein